jgi:casein kinase I family protein HRR25
VVSVRPHLFLSLISILIDFIGVIQAAFNIITNQAVAVKLELSSTDCPRLEHEAHIYQVLSGGEGIPRLLWFGTESEYTALVTNRLGHSVEDEFQRCNRKFDLKRVVLLGEQMVCLLVLGIN